MIRNYSQPFWKGALMASIMLAGLITIVGSGSSGDDATAPPDITVDLSGTVRADDGTPIEGVSVEVFLANALGAPEDTDTTNASGEYTVTVLESAPAYTKFAKTGYATLNSEFDSYAVNTSKLDIEPVTVNEAEAIIDTVFGGMMLDLADKAWLAVTVENANGDEVNDAAITSAPVVDGGGALKCDGTLTGSNMTVAPCNPDRDGPMYLAYFDADHDSVSVTVSGSSGTVSAPVRVGEITFIEIEQ